MVRLLRDENYARSVGMAGRRFIEERFSEAAVAHLLRGFLGFIEGCRPKPLSMLRRVQYRLIDWYDRNLAWRMR